MSRRNRPSLKEVSNYVNQAVPLPIPPELQADLVHVPESGGDKVQTATEQQSTTVGWRKSTIPFREDQYRDISKLLSELHTKLEIQLTIAEVVRLGLDKMLQALGDDKVRDQVLRELHGQQKRESQGNENLKHSRSRGLNEYLSKRGLANDQTPQPE